MKRILFLTSAVSLGLSLVAAPVVSNLSFSQAARTKAAEITFDLNEAAIVTLSITTNGVPIASGILANAEGDVNRAVAAGARRITWRPTRVWPNQNFKNGEVKVELTAWATNTPPDYMVVDLAHANDVKYYASVDQLPGGLMAETYKREKLVMRRIPAANVTWLMGTPRNTSPGPNRATPHWVTLTKDYYLSVFTVTQAQYRQIDPSKTAFSSDLYPAYGQSYNVLRGSVEDGVNWPSTGSAVAAGSFLGMLRNQTGVLFDLATDAQWEYACRGGSSRSLCNFTDDISTSNINRLAWFKNSASAPQICGQKEPNAWGLYDMHGNQWEFVLDWCQDDLGTAEQIDPVGPSAQVGSAGRTVRGGGYSTNESTVLCGNRNWLGPTTANALYGGVRLACPAVAIVRDSN